MEAFDASMSSTIEDLKLPEIPQDALSRSLQRQNNNNFVNSPYSKYTSHVKKQSKDLNNLCTPLNERNDLNDIQDLEEREDDVDNLLNWAKDLPDESGDKKSYG